MGHESMSLCGHTPAQPPSVTWSPVTATFPLGTPLTSEDAESQGGRVGSQHRGTLGPLGSPEQPVTGSACCHKSHLGVTPLESDPLLSCCVTPASRFTSLFPKLPPRDCHRSESCQHKGSFCGSSCHPGLAWAPHLGCPWVLRAGH